MPASPPTMPIYWQCLSCDEHGQTTATEAGADAKHVKATGHPTTTSLDADALTRMRERRAPGCECPCHTRDSAPSEGVDSAAHNRVIRGKIGAQVASPQPRIWRSAAEGSDRPKREAG